MSLVSVALDFKGFTRHTSALFQVGHLTYLPSYVFPVYRWAWQLSLFAASYTHWGIKARFLSSLLTASILVVRPHWGYFISHMKDTTIEGSFYTPEEFLMSYIPRTGRNISPLLLFQPFQYFRFTMPQQRFTLVNPSMVLPLRYVHFRLADFALSL